MTFQIGRRGTSTVETTTNTKPEKTEPVGRGLLQSGPNVVWDPPAGAPHAWQNGVVSAEAKAQRAEAELNGTAITIGASEARVAAGEAIKQAQAQTAATTTTVNQETTTENTDDSVDVVGTASKDAEEALKNEAQHDDQVAKQRTAELDKISDARVQNELQTGAAVA